MMDNETYSIVDLEGYAKSVREGAAKSFSEDYSENLDDFISIKQITGLVTKYSLGKDDDGHFIITEEIFEKIFDEVCDWFFGVGLAKLAAKGLIECAWDDESNEMIFWSPNANTP